MGPQVLPAAVSNVLTCKNLKTATPIPAPCIARLNGSLGLHARNLAAVVRSSVISSSLSVRSTEEMSALTTCSARATPKNVPLEYPPSHLHQAPSIQRMYQLLPRVQHLICCPY